MNNLFVQRILWNHAVFCFDFQIRRQSDLLKQQENILSETRQQLVISQSQLEAANEDIEKLDSALGSYKQKYTQATNQINHLETTVASLQEKLSDSRNQVKI